MNVADMPKAYPYHLTVGFATPSLPSDGDFATPSKCDSTSEVLSSHKRQRVSHNQIMKHPPLS